MTELTELLTGENASLIGAIVAVLMMAKRMLPDLFAKAKVKRILPLAPVAIALVAVFLGFGTAGDAMPGWQDKVVLGILVGFTSGQLYKAGKTSIFGKGIPDDKEKA